MSVDENRIVLPVHVDSEEPCPSAQLIGRLSYVRPLLFDILVDALTNMYGAFGSHLLVTEPPSADEPTCSPPAEDDERSTQMDVGQDVSDATARVKTSTRESAARMAGAWGRHRLITFH